MKKILTVLLCAVLAMGFTACAQQAAETSSAAPAEETGAQVQDDAIYGKVTAASGNEATIALGTVTGGMSGGTPPDLESGEMPSGEAPDMPSGEAPSEDAGNGGTPPDLESGEMPSGEAPDMSSGEAPSQDAGNGGTPPDLGEGGPGGAGGFTADEDGTEITVDLTAVTITKQDGGSETEASPAGLTEGTVVKMEGSGESESFVPTTLEIINAGGAGGPGGDLSGSETGSIELAGVFTVDGTSGTSDGEEIASSSADENTVLVKNGGSLILENGTLDKTGDTSSTDESNFYAVNAVFAAAGGSTAEISDTVLTSSAEGSNAIFATGEDSTVTADNVTIHTTGNSSRGLDATYGGTVNATNVDITTQGAHCAPIATDRGEGTITVNTGTVFAAGDGSPCIYSTGDITVNSLTGTAAGSQAAVVEGKNSITMTDTDLIGAGENGIMLYQSTSGDAAEGTARFEAADSRLTTTSDGPMIYVTNTQAEAFFENTELVFTSGVLANVAGNETNNWDTPGSNGGQFTLTGINQVFEGDVTCDEISTFALSLTQGSTFTGAVNTENTAQAAAVSLDADSAWTLTGDSYVTVLTNADETCANIVSGGHNLYYDADAAGNEWLGAQTIALAGGGSLMPA